VRAKRNKAITVYPYIGMVDKKRLNYDPLDLIVWLSTPIECEPEKITKFPAYSMGQESYLFFPRASSSGSRVSVGSKE